jgi:hypothetical protein
VSRFGLCGWVHSFTKRLQSGRFLAGGSRWSNLCWDRHIVVYSDTVGRTQVYLGSEELELLDRVARLTGASRSELVRRAVRSTFGERTKADKLRALEASAGSWHGRPFTGTRYVDSIRSDLNERLNRLGLE